jgi:hypothetical protein
MKKSVMTADQQARIKFEYALLRKFTPSFDMHEAGGDIFVEGAVKTGGGNQYRARILLPDNFPYAEPQVLLVHPKPLWTRDRRLTLDSLSSSHALHLKSPDPRGNLVLCPFQIWDASIPCVKIVLKVAIWVEAYEHYLQTGEDIATFLTRKTKQERQ